MIKFFRKIRQDLLMENKTGKYFKYAIGEIILVVIGILIALQINNWNENRKLQHEINTYLNQKLENLKEDRYRLIEIRDVRKEKAEKSKYILDIGIENVDPITFTNTVYFVLVERHFLSTIERNESSTTKYYAGSQEATINNLEQLYINNIKEMTLEENRLNAFSENAEFSLWTDGFLVDNRALFSSILGDMDKSKFKGKVPELILDSNNGQKALEGIFRRNELASQSLIVKLNKLIDINQQFIHEIEMYLN
ncbi:DUF6090 family protein [Winogradskyella alexanderae]|uniref:Uncharacterized protein n=1 Tax=Winogradskyella alexanderae TaxID=2877123 RepID=A0ABS7XWH7_9FLAO|nr:DUF6090 family protein [Winogradskyella alexanderae]MCA0133814.1 hypothetical protein [Winogradskyella alexanderae]